MTHEEFVTATFVGKFLVPTDNLSRMSDTIANRYADEFSKGIGTHTVLDVATDTGELTYNGKTYHTGDSLKMSEAAMANCPVYLIDGHHRYCGALKARVDLTVELIAVKSIDKLDFSILYDGLDAYEYFAK